MPGEAREDVGEADGRLDVVGRHVFEPGLLIVGPRPEVVVRGRDVALLVARRAGRRVQEAGRHGQVVEHPHVAPRAVLDVAVEPVVAALEPQLHLLA